jgi:hypothetical protein
MLLQAFGLGGIVSNFGLALDLMGFVLLLGFVAATSVVGLVRSRSARVGLPVPGGVGGAGGERLAPVGDVDALIEAHAPRPLGLIGAKLGARGPVEEPRAPLHSVP